MQPTYKQMSKPRDIPFSQMQKISDSGIFIKHFSRAGKTTMKPHAHRDDYYIIILLTDGTATVDVDFETKALNTGDILIVSPWQVHNKPSGAEWQADGWLLAMSPDILSESEVCVIEGYSISPRPIKPCKNTVEDIDILCSMLERNTDTQNISISLASAIKNLVLASIITSEEETSGRYKAIVLKLKKLLDKNLNAEKRPAAYASMLNLSEVYLNEAVKHTTGLSVSAYIRNCAMMQAKRMFVNTSLSAKEIAQKLGYNDYAHFSKLFKKCAGKSPSEYRKNLK